MADNTPQSPDLQSAGVVGPEPDPGSILRALSMGQSPVPQGPLNTWATTLAGFGAGMQGRENPVIAQQQAQQESDRRTQLAMFTVMQSVAAQRRHANESLQKLGTDLLHLDNPTAKLHGGQIIGEQLRKQGIPVDADFGKRLAVSPLTLEKRKDAYLAILAGRENGTPIEQTNKYLVNYLGAPEDMLPQLHTEAGSEVYHRIIYGKSLLQEQLDIQKADRDEKRFGVMLANQDLALRKQDAAEARDVTRAAEAQQHIKIAEGKLKVAQDSLNLANRKLDWQMANGPQEKAAKALDHGEEFVNQMEAAALQAYKDGFLTDSDKGVVGGVLTGDMAAAEKAAKVKAKRLTDPYNGNWVKLTQHLRGDMIGYSRNVQGDIGPRFKGAFDGAIGILHPDTATSIQGFKEVINTMRSAIRLGREGKDTAKTLIIRHPDGTREYVPWKRGMKYNEGDWVEKVVD